MTASELIKFLQAMPPDAQVMHIYDGEARHVINHAWLTADGRVMTADTDAVCYSTEDRPIGAPSADENYWRTPKDSMGTDASWRHEEYDWEDE